MSNIQDAIGIQTVKAANDTQLKAAFTEGYNAYARQFTAKYDVEVAWNTSVTRRIAMAGQQTT